MLSFILYIKARSVGPPKKSWALYISSLLAGFLAFASKEISATLPAFIILYEWFFFQDLDRSWLKRNLIRLLMLLPVLVLITILYLGIHPLERILATYEIRDFTLVQRVLTEFRVVVFYLSLLILPLPSRLNLQHDFVLSNSIVDPTSTLIAIITVVLLLGLSIFLARRDRLISFCILWFLGNLVIESSVIGLEIVYEHRNYLPSMLTLLMIVSLALQYNRLQVYIIGVICSVALLFALWTYQRNYTWTDDLLLWQDSVDKSPLMARPRNNLANAHSRRGQHAAAIEQLELAIQLQPGNARTHFNLANEYREAKKANEAIKHYTVAIKFLPDFVFAHNNLAALLNDMGMTPQAIEHYLQALEIDPVFVEAHNNLGAAYAKQGDYQKALQYYEKALSLNPGDVYAQKNIASVYNELGSQLAKQGMTSQAIEHYSQALRFWPAYADIHFNLGMQLAKQGMTSQAIEHYSQAIKIEPTFFEAHTNLGIALARQGDYRKALKHFKEALKANPNSAEIHNSLGVALIKMGRLEKAIEHFSTAVNINPGYKEAKRNLNAGLLLRERQ
jgi:tetratricopeptide (TPR) repeat protein